jgi:hypothetical protein
MKEPFHKHFFLYLDCLIVHKLIDIIENVEALTMIIIVNFIITNDIILSILLRYTDSDYPFDIFNLYLSNTIIAIRLNSMCFHVVTLLCPRH